MTELFDTVVSRVRERTREERDQLALGLMSQMAEGRAELQLSEAQAAEVRATLARLESGEEDIVPADEMSAFWSRCGL